MAQCGCPLLVYLLFFLYLRVGGGGHEGRELDLFGYAQIGEEVSADAFGVFGGVRVVDGGFLRSYFLVFYLEGL